MSESAAAVLHDPDEYLEYLNSPGIWERKRGSLPKVDFTLSS